jgi:hypothetical protein
MRLNLLTALLAYFFFFGTLLLGVSACSFLFPSGTESSFPLLSRTFDFAGNYVGP